MSRRGRAKVEAVKSGTDQVLVLDSRAPASQGEQLGKGEPSNKPENAGEHFPRLMDPQTEREIPYIHDLSFVNAPATTVSISRARAPRSKKKPPEGIPSYLVDLWTIPLLNHAEETKCFRNFHFLKYQAAKLQEELRSCRGWCDVQQQFDSKLHEAQQARNLLVESNLRLVVSIAKKYAAQSSASLDELISSGNIALLNAVEQFDYRKGFRFSTYAYQAIQRGIFGLLREENKRRERFATDAGEKTQVITKDASESDRMESAAADASAHVQQLLDTLAPRERKIVMARFGFGSNAKPCSYQKIGEIVGLSKQRVGDVFAEAMAKLQRTIATRKSKRSMSFSQ